MARRQFKGHLGISRFRVKGLTQAPVSGRSVCVSLSFPARGRVSRRSGGGWGGEGGGVFTKSVLDLKRSRKKSFSSAALARLAACEQLYNLNPAIATIARCQSLPWWLARFPPSFGRPIHFGCWGSLRLARGKSNLQERMTFTVMRTKVQLSFLDLAANPPHLSLGFVLSRGIRGSPTGANPGIRLRNSEPSTGLLVRVGFHFYNSGIGLWV